MRSLRGFFNMDAGSRRKSRVDRRKQDSKIDFPDRRCRIVKDIEVETTIKEESVELKLKNPICSVNSYQLKDLIEPLMQNRSIKTIILDIKNVLYIDSLVLGILLEYHKRCKFKGKKIILLNPQRLIRSLLKIMKLNAVFEIKFTSPEIIS